MSPERSCKICRNLLNNIENSSGEDRYIAVCNICGKYVSSDLEDRELNEMSQEDRAMLSAYTREIHEKQMPPPDLNILSDKGQLVTIVQRYKEKSIYEKMEKLILYLAEKTSYFGEEIEISFTKDYPLTYSSRSGEFSNIFYLCANLNLIEIWEGLNATEQPVKLSIDGWKKADEIRQARTHMNSDKVFIAMSCDEALRPAYDEGIKCAIEEAGYRSVFIEREEHNEKICDLVLAEIRACKFLIAEVTGQRQNVYYEAGFAQGLNKEVIWTCKESDIREAHFDTRQFNHILWENPEDLRIKLANRIKATIL